MQERRHLSESELQTSIEQGATRSSVAQLLLMKDLLREGWERRGFNGSESVAEHSFGVAVLVMFSRNPEDANIGRAIQMAVIHDLSESNRSVGDIIPADGMSKEEKYALERASMIELCLRLPNGETAVELFEELEAKETPESRIVKAADVLDMMCQVCKIEDAEGVRMDDFWTWAERYDFGPMQDEFNALRDGRSNGMLFEDIQIL